jgi:uncharacterized protein YkwD
MKANLAFRSVLMAWLMLPFGSVLPVLAESARPVTTASIPAKAKGFSTAQAIAEISAYRVAQGLSPVRADAAAMQAAQQQSAAMAQSGSMSHSAGGGFSSRLSAAGLGNVRAVENIAMGQRSWREVFEAWKASSSHDANFRASGMTRAGVAQVAGPNGPYWTVILVGEPGKFW